MGSQSRAHLHARLSTPRVARYFPIELGLEKDGAAVALEDVKLQYGAFRAIRDISFTVPRGQFVAVVGPTGCGKSSVLNMVAGLLGPTSGTVRTGGNQVEGVNRDCAYMFQADALLPWKLSLIHI